LRRRKLVFSGQDVSNSVLFAQSISDLIIKLVQDVYLSNLSLIKEFLRPEILKSFIVSED
jgi:hypothetical protein